jgi:hypothetical protein
MVFDAILEALCVFDWISPLVGFLQDMMFGPAHTFLIPEECGWSGHQIKQMLTGHGIRVWGLMFHGHTLLLSVRNTQARWAEYLLTHHGIPLLNEGQGWQHTPRQRDTAKRPTRSIESIGRWLDDLGDAIGI